MHIFRNSFQRSIPAIYLANLLPDYELTFLSHAPRNRAFSESRGVDSALSRYRGIVDRENISADLLIITTPIKIGIDSKRGRWGVGG